MGHEDVEGRLAWHVRFSFEQGSPTDLWIDEAANFRVYRRDSNGVQTFSYYENEGYLWLPSLVVSKAYHRRQPDSDDVPRYIKEMHILEGTAEVKLPKGRWTLAGMKLPAETDVVDYKLSESIGKWNGKRLISDSETVPQTGSNKFGYVIYVLLFFPVFYIWLSKKKLPRK